jgi:hypothetical protein
MTSSHDVPDEVGSQPVEPPLQKRPARAWSGIARDLSPDDLSEPGAQKLLLDELERLSRENEAVSLLRDDLHREQLDCADLKGQLRTKKATELVAMATSNVGALLFGLAPLFVEKDFDIGGYALGALGAALVIVGFLCQRISHE